MIRFALCSLPFTLLLPIPAATAMPPPQPKLVRVFVVDTSSSMKGSRIEQARRELLAVARQLPPSPAQPVIIIPFTNQAGNVQRFLDLPALETCLQGLQAGGGTSIASGLECAMRQIEPHRDAQHICVFLYTDGEDSDAVGIQRQEERLDAMFGQRSQRGLQQTLLFRRWEGANAKLLAQVSRRGHTRVIDAGDFKLLPVTLKPAFSVQAVRWSAAGSDSVEVEVNAAIDVSAGASAKFGLLRVTCTTPNASGMVAEDLHPGDPQAKRLTVRFPVPANDCQLGRTEVTFDLAAPGDQRSPEGIVVPLLTLPRVRLPVELPRIHVRTRLQGTLTPAGPAVWSDPLVRRAAVPLTLKLEAASQPNSPWLQPVTFRIVAAAGSRFVGAEPTLTLHSQGVATAALTLELTPPLSGPCEVGLTVAPQNVPTHLAFEPAVLRINQPVAPPPWVQTTLSVRPLRLHPPAWTDLHQGLASCAIDAEFTVDGPLASGTILTVQSPPAVRHLELNPARLHSGTQTVRLTCIVELRPAPHTTALFFQLVPPAPQGAVRIVAPPALAISVTGPAPVQLLLLDPRTQATDLRVTLTDWEKPTVFGVMPALRGTYEPCALSGLQGQVQADGPIGCTCSNPFAVDAPLELSFQGTTAASPSYFFDTRIETELVIMPLPASPAVVGSRQPVSVTIEAPFKRLLFYLACASAVILVAYLLGRMLWRLTTCGTHP